ncbi:MAG: hypothetical protein K2N36_01540, partial [Ruminiclostridium sp.]|nr:hypothetical protein [Ruminiclostridium sp.]
ASLREGFSWEKFRNLADRFGLDVNKRLSGFSKGMRRQSDIVIALSYGAKYLLCDETFDGLDPITRELTKKIFMEEMTDNNATILMSSHNLREMEDICDRILLIDNGRLVLSADIDDMRGLVNKYQLVLENSKNNISFDSLNVSALNNSGKMITFIADGNSEEVEASVRKLAAEKGNEVIYIEAVPLSLEEIFMYKLKKSDVSDREVI